ncbi:MAG TPA: prevent-host-death family protein [Gammaproteobacteria bacterium]|nr:prevent-host-death family protein [Gammaproteobacteria bacterium]
MRAFSIRDLRERTGELSQEAEKGNLALITKHGHPLFVSLPFTEELLKNNIHVILAESLYRTGSISIGKASKLAGQSIAGFSEYLSKLGIPVIDYTADELDKELKYLQS